MPLSEAKSKANAKWDAENMGRVTLALRKTLIEQIQEAADREGITRDRWLKNTIKGNLEENMTKTMTIDEAITQLTTTKPHRLNIPETMALAATMLRVRGAIERDRAEYEAILERHRAEISAFLASKRGGQ